MSREKTTADRERRVREIQYYIELSAKYRQETIKRIIDLREELKSKGSSIYHVEEKGQRKALTTEQLIDYYKEWSSYYTENIQYYLKQRKNVEQELARRKEQTEKLQREITPLVAITLVAAMLGMLMFMQQQEITGRVVLEEITESFTDSIEKMFTTSAIYDWEPTAYAATRNVTAVKVTGRVEGTGIARVYLEDKLIAEIILEEQPLLEVAPEITENVTTENITAIATAENLTEVQETPEALPEPTGGVIREISATEKRFKGECVETCSLDEAMQQSYALRIELEGSISLEIEEIVYSTKELKEKAEMPAIPAEFVRLNASIKDKDKKDIESEIELGEAIEEDVYNVLYTGRKLKHEGQIKKGNYHAMIKPKAHVIKEMELFNLTVEQDMVDIIDIDDMPEQAVPRLGKDKPDWIELYALNPKANFTEAIVTLTAKGTKLYKCKEWDFATRTCSGSWQPYLNLVPGQNYTLKLDANDPGYGEINITNATHLDENYNFISNIYENVSVQDDIWSEQIPTGHYARATFAENLTSGNNINTFVRGDAGGETYYLVYEFNSSREVARSPPIMEEGMVSVKLQNVSQPMDTFDIRTTNAEPSNTYLEYDYIHDSACGSLTADTVLDSDVSGTDTCFSMDANYITLDCAGFTVNYATSARGNGVVAVGRRGLVIKNCMFRAGNTTNPFNIGVNFTRVNETRIINNTIITNGTDSSYGIYLSNRIGNVSITNNTIKTNGNANNYGIFLQNNMRNISVSNNSISTNGTGLNNYGVYIVSGGSINITDNRMYLNGSSGTNGIRIDASNNNTRMEDNIIYAVGVTDGPVNGIFILNNITEGKIIGNSITVNSSDAAGTCSNRGIDGKAFNSSIAGNTISVDCRNTDSEGIEISGSNNNITDNTIYTNATFGGGNDGIALSTDFSRVENNTIKTYSRGTASSTSPNDGIELLVGALHNSIINNTIYTDGRSTKNRGIFSRGANTTIIGNRIYTNGSGSDNYGIHIFTGADSSAVADNIIWTNGTQNNTGIMVANATNTSIVNNTIKTNSRTVGGSVGIMLYSNTSLATIAANTISTSGGTDNYGIWLLFNASWINLSANTIQTNGTSSYGIIVERVSNISINNTVLNNTIQWMLINKSIISNITNITFIDSNGSIRFPENLTIGNATATYDITRDKINVSYNRSFVNASNLTFLNTSTVITLDLANSGITNPQPLVDLVDTNDYTVCAAARCTEQSFTNNLFTFNVSGWTIYAANQTPGAGDTVIPNVSYPGPPSGSAYAPDTQVTLSANITDDVQLSFINASITHPNSSISIITMFNSSVAFNSTNPPNNFSVLFNVTDQAGTYTVRFYANDTTDNKNSSITTSFTINSLVSILISQSPVAFGDIGAGEKNDTVDNAPAPFGINNTGNVNLNVTINASSFFSALSLNASAYQYNCTEGEGPNCPTGSTLTVTDMPLANATLNRTAIFDLPWQGNNDSRDIDIFMSVPTDESGGLKTSTVTFTASQVP
ncbi:right-handed parallel beta-helix repeat-containing protein [Candidatus Woesearchaeota archaeon]|nr:right-handed parallel beta-helix repeat-containing protein [Candidatus Woesearchaeota archaeon]